jgi:hypothetical protein
MNWRVALQYLWPQIVTMLSHGIVTTERVLGVLTLCSTDFVSTTGEKRRAYVVVSIRTKTLGICKEIYHLFHFLKALHLHKEEGLFAIRQLTVLLLE